ncbi:hypothetical protein ACE4RU_03005 [Actinobacillus seminis]|uniref:hypothetical protein n=1 Tax=Actinobacillus seminis TaxID=722 RepID=UPI003B924AA8
MKNTNWQGNKAEGKNSIAIGYKAMTDNNAENSVAVGNMSEAKEAKVFSVGSDSLKRRVVNVEKGKIDTASYDAINGSQLYALASKIGLTVNGATGGTGNTQNNTDFGDLGITLTSVKNNNGANTGGTGTAPGNGVTNGSTIKNKPTTIKEAIESLDKVIASVMSKESYIEFEGNSSNGTATAPQPAGTTAQNAGDKVRVSLGKTLKLQGEGTETINKFAGDNIRVVKKANGADGKDATLEIKLAKDLKNLDTVTIDGNQMTGGNTTTQGNGKQTVLTSEKIEIGKALNGNAGSGSTNNKAPITLDTTQKDSPKIEFATTDKNGKKQGTGQISGLKDISDEEAKKDPTLATNVKFVQDEVKKSGDELKKTIEKNKEELTKNLEEHKKDTKKQIDDLSKKFDDTKTELDQKFETNKEELNKQLETTKKEFNDKIKVMNDAKPFDYYTEDGKKIVKVKENKDGKDIYKFYEAKEDGSKGDKEVAIE